MLGKIKDYGNAFLDLYNNNPVVRYGTIGLGTGAIGFGVHSLLNQNPNAVVPNPNDVAASQQMQQMDAVNTAKIEQQLQQLNEIAIAKERMRRAREVMKEPERLIELQNENQLNRYFANTLGASYPL